MTVTASEISQVQAIIKPLIGKGAWRVLLGFANFITLEFGEKISAPHAPDGVDGEWRLWITYCAWRLENGQLVIASCDDERNDVQEAVQSLENLSLLSVEFTPPSWETTMAFEEGFVLRLFPTYTKEQEHWMLFTPDGNVLTIGPGTQWSYESSSLP